MILLYDILLLYVIYIVICFECKHANYYYYVGRSLDRTEIIVREVHIKSKLIQVRLRLLRPNSKVSHLSNVSALLGWHLNVC